jgi:hypothetical protein
MTRTMQFALADKSSIALPNLLFPSLKVNFKYQRSLSEI